MPERLQKLGLIEPGDNLPSTDITPETSFNECLQCEFSRNGCSGPNLLVTDIDRVCELLQAQRLKLRLSYQKLADIAEISVLTVKRILNNQVKDPSFQSIQRLVVALFADPHGKFPCPKALLMPKKETEAVLYLKEKLEEEKEKSLYFKEQICFKEEQMRLKDKQIIDSANLLAERRDYIKKKDKMIGALGAMLAVCVLVIITALVVDITNPNIGFFWR